MKSAEEIAHYIVGPIEQECRCPMCCRIRPELLKYFKAGMVEAARLAVEYHKSIVTDKTRNLIAGTIKTAAEQKTSL